MHRPALGAPAMLVSIARDNGGVDARRAHVFLALLARYVILVALRWGERTWMEPRAAAHRLPADPIFILGHWRSGTTYLQELLSCDPQLTSSTLYDCLLADVSMIGRPWLEPLLDGLARALRLNHSLQRMPLRFSLPAEADVALCTQLSPFAYTWGHLFPRRFEAWMHRCVFDPEPAVIGGWLDAVDAFARKCSLAAGGRRVVLKSPGDTARVARLVERFPRACFVYIHRDPLDVFHSSRYLWDVILREFSLQTVPGEAIDGYIVRTYRRLLIRYLDQRASVPAAQLVELRYEDLRAQPLREMQRIYAHLGLGAVPSALLARLKSAEPYPTSAYVTPPDLEARLRRSWAFAFDGWPEAGRG